MDKGFEADFGKAGLELWYSRNSGKKELKNYD